MRLKYIIPFALGEDAIARRAAQIPAAKLESTTVVDCVPVRNHPDSLGSYYDAALFDMYVVEAGLDAEDEGYDAVLMDTVSDSGLRTLRSRLTIPVVGPGIAAYAMAVMLGRRFTIVTYLEEHKFFFRDAMDSHHLWGCCASIRAAGLRPGYLELSSGPDADEVTNRLVEAANLSIVEDGAEVVVLGSTTMFEAGRYMATQLPVPIVNPGPVALKAAETMVQLGVTHSKRGYPAPRGAKDALWHGLAGVTPSGGPGHRDAAEGE